MTADSALDLNHVAIETPDGRVLRYARYVGADGAWIRHGPFIELFPTGQPASQGEYAHGKESGMWRDFYPSGQVAAEGSYVEGQESGLWKFWNEAGQEERTVLLREGVEVSPVP